MNKQYREASRCSTGPRVMHARPHWKAEDVKAQRTPTVRAEHEEGRTTRHTRPYPNPAVTYYSFPPGGFRSPERECKKAPFLRPDPRAAQKDRKITTFFRPQGLAMCNNGQKATF